MFIIQQTLEVIRFFKKVIVYSNLVYYTGNTGGALVFPEVNEKWLKSVLVDEFQTTRHHVTDMGNKTKARDFIANHFENLSLIVQYDEFISANREVKSDRVTGFTIV